MSLNVRDSIAYLNAMSFTSGNLGASPNLGTSENLGNNIVTRDENGNFSAEDVDVNQITASTAILGITSVTDLTTALSSSHHVVKEYSATSSMTIDTGVVIAIVKNTRVSGNITVYVPAGCALYGHNTTVNTAVLAAGETAMIHLCGYDTDHYLYIRITL